MTGIRRLATGAGLRRVNLAARVAVLPSPMERGNKLRAVLYASPRWRRERRAFLKAHPICITAGCGKRSTTVDHRDGHQRDDWLLRFWDKSTWQPMCGTCHAIKSRAELHAWQQAGEASRGGGSERSGPRGRDRRGSSRESGP